VTLYRRGRKYSIQLWVDGVRYLKSTGTTNRREAEAIERDFRDELIRRRHQIREASPEMTFADLASRFLADASPRPHHLDRLKVLLPYYGDWEIRSISKPSLREYRKSRRNEKSWLTETTLNRDIEVLRHLLYWAVDEGILAASPLTHVHLPKPRKKPKPILNLAEEDKLLLAAAPHLAEIIITAVDSGMRRKELLTQRREHIDLHRRVLQVTCSKTPEGDAREVPLTARLTALFTNMLRDKREGLLFTYKGRPIHRIKTAWKAAVRRAGIRVFRFHDLRHTFNTRLMEAGVIQDVRMAIMGHSPGGTNALYTHIELPAMRKAIRKLEIWLEAERNQQQINPNGENDGRYESIHQQESDRDDAQGLSRPGGGSRDQAQPGDRLPE
jgi:integrase